MRLEELYNKIEAKDNSKPPYRRDVHNALGMYAYLITAIRLYEMDTLSDEVRKRWRKNAKAVRIALEVFIKTDKLKTISDMVETGEIDHGDKKY